MRKLNDSDKILIIEMMKDGCSDSVIEDFSIERHLSISDVFHFIAVQNAPGCCKNCNHVDYFPNMFPYMFPCSSCCRAKEDYYEDVSSLH